MDNSTISKAPPPHKSMDYHFLREEGIKHIQELAGKLWTDYNSHDPGITLLEVLCYAITDLGYRTNLPIEDLLAGSQTESGAKDFYGITDILPCNPVTLTDLRKVIIDQDGIRNAWVEELDNASVRGLYNVMLELEKHDDYGDLNFNLIASHITVDAETGDGLQTYNFDVAFPFWDELDWIEEDQKITAEITIAQENNADIFTRIRKQENPQESTNDYYTKLKLEIDNDTANLRLLPIWVKMTSEVSDHILDSTPFQDAIKANLVEGTLVNAYWEKIKEATITVNRVKNILQDRRSLCEDFQSFSAFWFQEVSIHANIDLSPYARTEEVLSEIYYRIHDFLSPRPQFYTLEEMLDKGRAIEEIFEGPLLKHGFLDTEELEAIRQQDTIYTSDLLQLMTDVPGVIAVRDLRISNYDEKNNILEVDVINCLRLISPELSKPLLSLGKSSVNCYKNLLPVRADMEIVSGLFESLKNQARQEKKEVSYKLTAPQGEDRQVANYFSIQHHFPTVYGIGTEKLPPSAPDSRKAGVAQLQGYLIFFEQLLANHFSQLANVKSLFSMEPSVTSTYFSQSLAGLVPGMENLLSGSYEENLPDIVESKGNEDQSGLFHERRNRFLNHLMARFNESFSEYALLHHTTTTENTLTTAESLITDKTRFLTDYPVISRDRGKGFNYLATVWNTDENVSGLKKRIARKLGLKSYERNYLFNERQLSYYFNIMENEGNWSFALNTDHITNSSYTLESLRTDYASQTEAETAAHRTAFLATQPVRYRLTGTLLGKDLSFDLIDDEGDAIACTNTIYEAEANRNAHIEGIISFLSVDLDDSFSSGGFHMLEHMLLRPDMVTEAIESPEVLSIPVGEGENSLADPYSFRISVILPMQHSKFGNAGFRRYAERVINSETPSHIVPHIYWVDITQMNNFEAWYEPWLTALSDGIPAQIMEARNGFITNVLNTLVSNG